MKKIVLYILPLFVLLTNSCKKQTPLPPDEVQASEPVFYFKADVNGSPIEKIEAGINNYFMDSKWTTNSDGVYVYEGDLVQKTCNSCGYAVSILINDNKISTITSAPMSPDSALVLKKYEYNDGVLAPLGYLGTFSNMWGATEPITYTFHLGSVTSNVKPASCFFSTPGTVTLSMNMEDGGGCQTSHSNVFDVANPLHVNISHQPIQPKSFRFFADVTKANTTYTNYTLDWDFGDGSQHMITTSNLVSHTYSTTDEQHVKLTVTDNTNNNTCVSYYQVPALGGCHANFTSTFTPVLNTKALSAVTLKITDAATGKVYSSQGFDQPSDSYFEILSVEDYKNNTSGDKTKKLKVKLSCILKNGNESMSITNGEAVIAVSYK